MYRNSSAYTERGTRARIIGPSGSVPILLRCQRAIHREPLVIGIMLVRVDSATNSRHHLHIGAHDGVTQQPVLADFDVIQVDGAAWLEAVGRANEDGCLFDREAVF